MRLLKSSPAAAITSSAGGSAARRSRTPSRVARSSSKMAFIAPASSPLPSRPRLAASTVCRCETASSPSRTASSCPRLAASARPSSRSVVPPSADTTTTGARSRSRASATIVITRLMAAASTTDEPPNFITSARMRGLLASVRAKKRPPALFEAGGRGDPWSSLSAVSEHRRPHNRPAGPLGPLSIGVVDHRAMHWRRFYYTPRQSVFNTSIGGTRSVRRAGR